MLTTHLGLPLSSVGGGAAPGPNPPAQTPPGISELAIQVISWLKWGVLAAGMIGILVCAGMVIVGRRRRGGLARDGLIGSLWVLGELSLASVAAALVGALASIGTP